MERFLLICLAGALGTGTRYLVGTWAGQRLGAEFPFGTLIVNLCGCFLLAVVMELALNLAAFSPNLRVALATGFMGGLTTYSSFNDETTRLLRDGGYGVALLNVSVTFVGCFFTGLAGLALARRLLGS